MRGRIIETNLHVTVVTVLTEHDFGKLQYPHWVYAESDTFNYICTDKMTELELLGQDHASQWGRSAAASLFINLY